MKDSIFRLYDIRGKVGSELDLDRVYDLTCAIAFYFKKQNPNLKTFAVGMDGRTHSPVIKERMCSALIDSGFNVRFIGMCSTPVLYFTMHAEPVDAGLMITASHNPGEYNGIKLCLGKGGIWGEQITEIKKLFHEKQRVTSDSKGSYSETPMIPSYIDWLVDNFADLVDSDISALIDCGNGAAGTVLPQLLQAMRWKKVELLYPEVDGSYPNHEADPTVEENMQDLKKILEKKTFDFGLGLDGDCDRMAPMTQSGFLVPGDQLLAVFAQNILKKHPGISIVFDIKSSSGLIELLDKWGASPIMSPSGHSIIKQNMKKHSAILAGELSCHFTFKDRHFGFDDGVYAMMRLFEIMLITGKSLDQLISIFPKKISSPEFRIICDDAAKWSIVDEVKDEFSNRDDITMITIDGVRATMDYGWGIIRVSNTQPAITLRFESDSQNGLQQVKEDFFNIIKKHFNVKELKKKMQFKESF